MSRSHMARQASTASQGEARPVLVLQGGGALGAYQAGVFEALAEAGVHPSWLAGISIGALNAALIAGNPPERQVERLREFWTLSTQGPQIDAPLLTPMSLPWVTGINAASAVLFGVPGFFTPRTPPPQFQPPGIPGAVSWYDTTPLRATLERLIDFDRLNAGETRLSMGAVDIETGNFEYFETGGTKRIEPEHIMASCALPPGLPPIRIDGAWYWDGGLVSNTPLEFVLQTETRQDLAIFQVDLFPARGALPKTLAQVNDRVMDIRYSSRTRLNTDQPLEIRRLKRLARELIEALPPDVAQGEAARRLAEVACENAVTVVQLIYRGKPHENGHRDFEFSRATMLQHWQAGLEAARRALQEREEILKPAPRGGVKVFDGAQETSP
jgi:NTE family protein